MSGNSKPHTVDELAAELKRKGGPAVITEEPEDQPWGCRQFVVTDPHSKVLTRH
jgi:uncharacterized glyoxalase superfamily protein PhnB